MRNLFVLIALAAIMFASCKKYETSDPLDLNTLPKVTLTGTVYADLNERLNGVEPLTGENLDGSSVKIKVQVSVPYANYFSGNNSDGNWLSAAVDVDADGNFSIDVPVVSGGVTATVSFSDFTYNVKKSNTVGQEYTVLRHFTCNNIRVSNLGEGETNRIIEAVYNPTSPNPNNDNVLNPTGEVTVTGKLEYESDNNSTTRGIPVDTKVTVIITLTDPDYRIYKKTQTIQPGYDGIYTIQVPMVEQGTATVRLVSEGFWQYTIISTGDQAYYRYTLDRTMTIYNYSIQKGKNYTYTRQNKVSDI
jgi:hypothetical protein